MKKYKIEGVVEIGNGIVDGIQLDTPTFEIVDVRINMATNELTLEVMHEVNQGSLIRKHSRNIEVDFKDLPSNIKTTGLAFLDALDVEMLKFPQYAGAEEV